MKIFYLLCTSLLLTVPMISQNAPSIQNRDRTKTPVSPIANTNHQNSERAAGPFRLWVDPVGNAMVNKGVDLDYPDQTYYLTPIFMDSTVTDGSGTPIYNILLGSVLDPKSTLLQSSTDPIVGANDSYSIDSISILGSYVKTTSTVDTLYTWLVWGAPGDTTVFEKTATSDIWVYPISAMRDTIIGAKIAGATGLAGNKVSAAAPSGNKVLIKYVLQQADSSASLYHKQILIPLATPVTIPAGNIVSCFYTFVPGTTYTTGDCVYGYTGGTVTQNQNGFAGITWGQYPQVTDVYDYLDHQVDPTSWGMGTSYSQFQRHSTSYGSDFMTGDLLTSPVIGYSIYGIATEPPNAPTNLEVTYNCTSFTVNWDSVAGATEYFIDISTDYFFSNFVSGYTNLNLDSLSLTINSLDVNSNYFFRVRAADSINVSLNSLTGSIYSQTLYPPAIYTATNVNCTSFVANWNDGTYDVNNTTGYFLDVSTSNTFTTLVSGYSNLNVGTSLSFAISGLDSNTTYYYRIRKMSDCGTSLNSNTQITTTMCNTTGINALNATDLLAVYPSPASDKLVVRVNKTGASTIQIIDALGKVVKQVNTNELTTEINVVDLENGIYFLKLNNASGSYTEKITISK